MFQTRLTCPHCSNLADFSLNNIAEYRIIGSVNLQANLPRVQIHRAMQPADRVDAFGVASCPLCHGPVMVNFEATLSSLRGMQAAANRPEERFVAGDVKILATYPTPAKASRDPAYPEELREIFAEAQEDLLLNRSSARIVATCRSVLDVATKKLNGKGKDLLNRIDNLREEGILTQSLSEWAHTVRINGNEAIHELTATKQEAAEIIEFIKMFLDVAFVLPTRIAERRAAGSNP